MFARLAAAIQSTTLHFRDANALYSDSLSGATVEILDLRHFSSVDLRALLNDEIQLWGRLLSWDYSGSAPMILRHAVVKIFHGEPGFHPGPIFRYVFFVFSRRKGLFRGFVRTDSQPPSGP